MSEHKSAFFCAAARKYIELIVQRPIPPSSAGIGRWSLEIFLVYRSFHLGESYKREQLAEAHRRKSPSLTVLRATSAFRYSPGNILGRNFDIA